MRVEDVAGSIGVSLGDGAADTSAPPQQSAAFASALRDAGVRVAERYYPGKTHTDPFVTDPILGGHDELLEDIVAFIRGGCGGEPEVRVRLPALPALLPRALVAIARTMVPF